MPVITTNVFDGLRPIQDPILLNPSEATIAVNARLLSGSLSALKGTTTLKALTKASPATIWRYGADATETNWWLEFLADTDVMRSPAIDDAYNRAYWTDGSTAKYAPNALVLSGSSYPGASYTLGIPKPAASPTVASFTAPALAVNSETRAYVYTYVSAYGEEGPPSDATATVEVDRLLSVVVNGMSVAPSGAYNITTKRIYRSSATGVGVEFQFLAEIPVATTSYTDTTAQTDLGEVMPSTTWVAPPANLRGLKMLPSGAAIGFVGNKAYLSEPNLPHAWPNDYTIDSQIVGIGVFRQSAVLLTNSYPYLLSGVDPQAMSLERMEVPQACVSKRSIVDTGDGVVYASPDGLVSISSAGINFPTKQLMSREQWQLYNPSSIVAVVHDNRYHMLYTTTAGVRGMLIFDFTGQGSAMTTCDVNTTTAVTAMYSDPRTDTLYLAQGTNIVRYNNSTSALTYTWRSKTFRAAYPANYGFAQVMASAYPVTFKVYADGVLKHNQTVASNTVFRLPSGFLALDWQMELTGTSDVSQMSVANSIEELRAT